MLQKVRKKIFWGTDWLRGEPVKKHFEDITSILEADRSKKITEKRTRELLEHAVSSTDFYKQYSGNKQLEDFPVVNKSIIRDNFERFQSNLFPSDEKLPAVTSGSTGTPFKVFHSQDKKNRNTADTLYFAQKAGYEIGQRLVYLKIWAKEKMHSPLHYWMQNMLPVDVITLSETEINSLVKKIESKHSCYSILGYVSALERICKYLDNTDKDSIDADVASIITMSEALTPYVKESMEKYFGTPVFARYSNLENGIIAQQIPGSGQKFLINTASYRLEMLAMDNNEPVERGDLGRIVITDLYNHAMPMIRYDTGDVGILSEETDRYSNQYLDKVEGRKLDVLYDTSGNIISSYIMYKNMWKYTEIRQYQLIQEDQKKYTFKINIDGNFEREQQLVEEYKSFLGEDADFRVEYVDEIPLLSSGKRKKTVNNWKN